MSTPLPSNSQVQRDAGDSLRESLVRQKLVQRICGQAVIYFGAFIVAVSLYKFVSAFSLDVSPWPELQLGVACLLLLFLGNFLN